MPVPKTLSSGWMSKRAWTSSIQPPSGNNTRKHPKRYKKKVKERISLFVEDPMNLMLNNHALTGKFQGYRSINITGDWRVIYSIRLDLKSKQGYYFELVGTHSQLYG